MSEEKLSIQGNRTSKKSIMFSVNTGEPPTPPNSTATTSPRSDPNAGDVAFRPANQSQDSGYDPSSPFSLHEGPRDSASTHFFTEDDVFDDCEDDVLLDADVEEEEDKERCPNCDTALPCICGRSGSSATDCTYTYFTASSSNCDSSSSDASSLSIRPSSMPIFIPRSCQNTHSNSNQRLPCSESSSAEINPSTSRPRMLTDFIFNNSHPGSLPAAVISFRNYMSPHCLLLLGWLVISIEIRAERLGCLRRLSRRAQQVLHQQIPTGTTGGGFVVRDHPLDSHLKKVTQPPETQQVPAQMKLCVSLF
ncbi:hypothetical protein CDAR_477211 [Caerostris darwini]|uniref:Uncharacterized protein n=1 Tax=Caerostris darwini TaxID=1538125 RepID=A0AAV4TSP0_9ARAC|nr:hypothetical protein CDAR_477211 [Caerostris darwini]